MPLQAGALAPGWVVTIPPPAAGGSEQSRKRGPPGWTTHPGTPTMKRSRPLASSRSDSPCKEIVHPRTSLTRPARKRAYPFSGMLRNSDRKDTPAGGASWGITVQQPSAPGPLCAPPNNSPPFPVEAAAVFAGVTGGSTLSLTTTVLPEHPVRSVNGYFRNGEARQFLRRRLCSSPRTVPSPDSAAETPVCSAPPTGVIFLLPIVRIKSNITA